MADQKKRRIDEILEDLQRINKKFRERVRNGLRDPAGGGRDEKPQGCRLCKQNFQRLVYETTFN